MTFFDNAAPLIDGALHSKEFKFGGRQYVAEVVLDDEGDWWVEVWDVTDGAVLKYTNLHFNIDQAEVQWQNIVDSPGGYVRG